MDFEEMKVIWDSQNAEPLFAVNEAGLHAAVRQKARTFARRILWRDAREISIGVVASAGLLVFSWTLVFWDEDRWRSVLGPGAEVSHGDAVMMLASSALFLWYGLYHFLGRKRQERRERQFESSLRGDIDRALAQIDYQIRRARGMVRWGLLPLALGSGLGLYVFGTIVPTPMAVWLLMPLVMIPAFILDARCKRRPITTELLPLKQEFEALRRKLTAPERVT